MSKAYKESPRTIQIGESKGKVVYTVTPVNYGTLTSGDVARQIVRGAPSRHSLPGFLS